jgi:hypothetical protein
MLHRLPRQFVASQVVTLAVMRRGSAVGVRRQIVKLRRSLMGIIRHVISPLTQLSR